jgi:hypothetical protein
VNSSVVGYIIGGWIVINKTLAFGVYIGQKNNGNHTTLFDDSNDCDKKPTINKCFADSDVVVPIVDHDGNFMGWATFHVVSASKNPKIVVGYFLDGFQNQQLSIGSSSGSTCQCYVGTYVLKLID